MPHDVVHVHGLRHTGILIKLPRKGPEVGVINQPFPVTFEVQVVNLVEP